MEPSGWNGMHQSENHNQNLSKARGVTPPFESTSQVTTGVFQERAPLAETKCFSKS
jgi:hypothetical protein